eukprot:gene10934-7589_t
MNLTPLSIMTPHSFLLVASMYYVSSSAVHTCLSGVITNWWAMERCQMQYNFCIFFLFSTRVRVTATFCPPFKNIRSFLLTHTHTNNNNNNNNIYTSERFLISHSRVTTAQAPHLQYIYMNKKNTQNIPPLLFRFAFFLLSYLFFPEFLIPAYLFLFIKIKTEGRAHTFICAGEKIIKKKIYIYIK